MVNKKVAMTWGNEKDELVIKEILGVSKKRPQDLKFLVVSLSSILQNVYLI